MQLWWCAALCVCARLAGGARAARPGSAAYAEPDYDDLSPGMLQEAIEMEQEAMDDPMLASVRAAGRLGAALCAGEARCAGALWARRWLLVRASCARLLPLDRAAVLPHRGLASCRNITPELGAIGVLATLVHPLHAPGERAYDAALLLLARAAPAPPHANHTRALLLAPELERWLEYTTLALPAAWERLPARARRLDVAALRLTSSPVRLLAAAVLLPAAALLLLFALALRLPGAEAIRYDLLEHDALEHAPEPAAPADAGEADAADDADATDRVSFL